jgi:hypothetical protein
MPDDANEDEEIRPTGNVPLVPHPQGATDKLAETIRQELKK